MTKDPYKYFRMEARELAEELGKGTLVLERDGANPEILSRLLRAAHTLKGAARVVRQTDLADRAHEIEDVLSPHRATGGPLSADDVARALALVDAIRAGVSALDAPPPDSASSGPNPVAASRELGAAANGRTTERPVESARVAIAEMDRLLDAVLQLGVDAVGLQAEMGQLDRVERASADFAAEAARILQRGSASAMRLGRLRSRAEELALEARRVRRQLESRVDRVGRDAEALRDQASRIRLVEAQSLEADLERALRDAAATAGVRADLQWIGGDIRLDAHVLAGIRGALMHLVRNAVAHGIEGERARRAAGKPPAGSIAIEVTRQGHRVVFRCRDDGRGIDLEGVRAAAVARGLARADDTLDMPRAVAMLLRGGLSTATETTHVSGRGVGLDAVRAAVSSLGGTVGIESEPGRGTSVDIGVPLSLSALPALAVEAGGVRALVPVDAVVKTFRLEDHPIVRTGAGDRLRVDDDEAPVRSLARLLRVSSPHGGRSRGRFGVLIRTAEGPLALVVDRIGEVRNVILRSLPAGTVVDPIVAAATLGPTGAPEIVLATHALVAGESRIEGPTSPDAARLPILVIDDSLTTRMLEQSILESAGYAVDLAVSAEEGLEKARRQPYSLFLVDVEMPGMSGFDFVELTRSDPVLGQIPAILVTSRGGAEDRARGLAAGAHDYVDKGEFDQQSLLRTIRGLVG